MKAGKVTIEVCVASHEGAVLAEAAGADRIELNSALELDGLSPSPGLFKRVRESISLPIICMARPVAPGFVYSEDQWQTLLADACWAMEQGAQGVAFGVLDSSGMIDIDRCRQMREKIPGTLVFHKAFDSVTRPTDGLESLIDCGVNRIMTSGQAETAMEGVDLIAKLVRQAAGRIELIPAGSVNSENCRTIISRTGADQIHGSFLARGHGAAERDRSRIRQREIEAVVGCFSKG